jgi:hypothetical protein
MSDTAAHPWKRLRATASRLRWSLAADLFDVFVREVRPEDAEFRAPEGYAFRYGEADDVLACSAHHTELDARDREHGALRLSAAHRVVLGQWEGETVFSMWVNPRHLNVPGHLKRKLGADQAFIYKAYTSPDHRGRKLYQAGMAFVLADLASRGQRELVGYAHVKKQASRAGLDRLGFRSAGTYRAIGLRPNERVFPSRALNRRFPERVPRSGVGWE